jgi:N,N-dimethylformamidase beta subunit-like, C-terminal/PKD domain
MLPEVRKLAVVALALPILAAPTPAFAANPIQAENALPGTTAWYVSQAPPPSIEGYTSQTSVLPGENVQLHVSTSPAARYRVEIYRLGWYGGAGGRLVGCVPGCATDEAGTARPHPGPDENGETVAGWPVTDEFPMPADAVSGYYVANLVLTSGFYHGQASTVFFVVRPPPTQRSTILVQVPVNTWQAYNQWGGKSLYEINSTGGKRAYMVSFDRPIAPGGQWPIVWEVPLVRFLEREGYDLSYQTDVDTHLNTASLLDHQLVMISGHDEYWTKEMRDGFDLARDEGTNLAFMGANAGYWQVRYQDGVRTLVGYKSPSDPIADPALKTILFRDLGRPECQLEGVMHQGGFRHPTDSNLDYRVNGAALSDPWFAGTGFDASSVLPDLVGREWDDVPDFPPSGCAQPGLEILFTYTGPSGSAKAVKYFAPSGARVFASGSLQFAWGLDNFATEEQGHAYPADPRLQQFMRNALADLTRPAAPVSITPMLTGTTVTVATPTVDPRIRQITVYRHEGAVPFALSDGVRICQGMPGAQCSEPEPPGHRTYVYAAVTTDQWSQSAPGYSAPVAIPDTPPVVTLAGPRRVRRRRRVSFAARATDRDGDTVTYRWRLDGRPLHSRSARVAVRFLRPGRHRLGVTAFDGFGGITRATAAITVR